jgi:CheY-like chemotaxis protein
MSAVTNSVAAYSLGKAELTELLRRMDATSHARVNRDRRKQVRYEHICSDVSFTVVQPGGGTSERLVTVRDLSSGGICILYPGYLHSGSPITVELRKRLGGKERIEGQIRSCRHVQGAWHAVGIKFKEPIVPSLFLSQTIEDEAEAAKPVKVDVSRLKGAILLVDDQMMDRSLFKHLLKGSSLRITEADSSEAALSLVARSVAATPEKSSQVSGPFDLIVCDLNLGGTTGESAIAQIRALHYKGPLLVMTAETDSERIVAATTAGATGVLQKPYTAEKLHTIIAAQLGEQCVAIEDPIYSELSADPQNTEMLEQFVAQARAAAVELRKRIVEDNIAQVRVICQSLKGTGAGYGFAVLTDVAGAAIISLDASCSIAESSADLHRLEAVCGRVVSAARPTKTGK